MILWSVQHESVLETIERDGVYHTNENYLYAKPEEDNDHYHAHNAYLWLAKKMRGIVGPPPSGVRYPIWAMYKEQGRQDGKMDMRTWKHDEPVVRLQLSVPDYDVLVTDFDMWHSALNYWYLSDSEADAERFDASYESLKISYSDLSDFSKKSPEILKLRREIEASWDRMIGVTHGNEDWWGDWNSRSYQATFWELKKEHIISAQHFA